MTDTILSLRREWSGLRRLEPEELVGDLRASFVAPLAKVAPTGLGLIGLPRWYGKRFRTDAGRVSGTNLLRSDGSRVEAGLREVMPMSLVTVPSLIDGLPTLVVSYPPDTRKPWPWVRDELRARTDGVVVGMTIVDLPVLRSLGGTPFLLNRD